MNEVALRFYPALPFGIYDQKDNTANFISDGNGHMIPEFNDGPFAKDLNLSTSCSPANPYFVGWDNIVGAYSTSQSNPANSGVLGKVLVALQGRLKVQEFDMINEMDLVNFPIYYRLIYDSMNTNGSSNSFIFETMQLAMSYNNFDPQRITWSQQPTGGTEDSNYSCKTVYNPPNGLLQGDARVLNFQELAEALGAGTGHYGSPVNATYGDNSHSVVSGTTFKCNGVFGDMSDAVAAASMLPGLWDIHITPCKQSYYPPYAGGNIDACDPSQPPSAIQAEATTFYSSVKTFFDGFAAGVNGKYSEVANSLFMNGEGYSGSIDTTAGYPYTSCEGSPYLGLFGVPPGINASTLANRRITGVGGTQIPGIVYRPWYYNLGGCYQIPNQINPPYKPSN